MRFYVISLSFYSIAVTVVIAMLIVQNNQLKSEGTQQKQVLNFQELHELDMQDIPMLGNPDAPISIVGYSDFECPACAMGSKTVYRLLDEFPGQIQIGFKNMPLSNHPNAPAAARAALAAYRQGMFWEMEKKLFENQNRLSPELYQEIAMELGLDMEEFNNMMAEEHWEAYLDEQSKEAKFLNIVGTPTFFVNGVKVRGASYELISSAITHFLKTNPEQAGALGE